MHSSVIKSVAVLGVTGVAVLGAQYASAAPHGAGVGHSSRHAVTPLRNVNYEYTAQTSGGSGEATYTIPNPPSGFYQASFTANFYPAGSPGAPEAFSCALIKNGSILRAQSTSESSSNSGFYVGVNASTVIKIDGVASFGVLCGTDDGTNWNWGTRSLQVNLLRVDGLQQRDLSGGIPAKRGELSTLGAR